MTSRDDELTITLSRREWVKICAALVMRTGVDRHAQPLIEKLHPLVIEPLIEADRATTEREDGCWCGCDMKPGRSCWATDREFRSPEEES